MNESFHWTCEKCSRVNSGADESCRCGSPRGDALLLANSSAVAVVEPLPAPTPLEPSTTLTAPAKVPEPIDLTATNPVEMRHAQHDLIEWMGRKLASVRDEVTATGAEAAELLEALERARKQKWNTKTIEKHHGLAVKRVQLAIKRVEYYEKIVAALQAGYYIVPPMDMELFAIRTDRNKPKSTTLMLVHSSRYNFAQDHRVLPAGDGDYRNPHPLIRSNAAAKQKMPDGQEKYPCWADDWKDIEFPINMLKPQIIDATTRAMALKVFDELGVLPQDFKRNPDPVILGRIYEPKKSQYHSPKVITFMVAWHLNTKDL